MKNDPVLGMASVEPQEGASAAPIPPAAADAADQNSTLPKSNNLVRPSSVGNNGHRYSRGQLAPAGKGALSREDAALMDWPMNLQIYLASLLETHNEWLGWRVKGLTFYLQDSWCGSSQGDGQV